jgi:hypothetical protein
MPAPTTAIEADTREDRLARLQAERADAERAWNILDDETIAEASAPSGDAASTPPASPVETEAGTSPNAASPKDYLFQKTKAWFVAKFPKGRPPGMSIRALTALANTDNVGCTEDTMRRALGLKK